MGRFIVGAVFPSRSVLVVVDDQHTAKRFLVGEIDNVRHILRHGHLDRDNVALASLSGSIGGNHLIAVGSFGLHLVGEALLRARSYSFKAFYDFTVAKDVDGEVLSQILAVDCRRWRGKRNDVLQFVGHLYGSQVIDSLWRCRIGSNVDAEAIDAQNIQVGWRNGVDSDIVNAIGCRGEGSAEVGGIIFGCGLADNLGREGGCCTFRAGHNLKFLRVVPRSGVHGDIVGFAAFQVDGQYHIVVGWCRAIHVVDIVGAITGTPCPGAWFAIA